jgi:serine/threonine protein kinase
MKNEPIYNSKYQKIKKIGNGAFGCVYKVKDISSDNGRFYAMKKFYLDNVSKIITHY